MAVRIDVYDRTLQQWREFVVVPPDPAFVARYSAAWPGRRSARGRGALANLAFSGKVVG